MGVAAITPQFIDDLIVAVYSNAALRTAIVAVANGATGPT
jgi:hypothetical protein